MKDRQRAKERRRDRRKEKARGGWRSRGRHGFGADDGSLANMLAAIDGLAMPGSWPEVAPRILPVLKRLHHPFPADAAPVHIHVPPGIPTGFGIDLGPAFGHVSDALLASWEVDRATLLATALDNLRRLTRTEPPDVQHVDIDGIPMTGIQGQGWGSSLLLLPEVLADILGPRPRVLLAPVRNTLIALPEDVDASVAISVWHALADGAPDELDVEPLRWTGRAVVAMGDRSSGRPN